MGNSELLVPPDLRDRQVHREPGFEDRKAAEDRPGRMVLKDNLGPKAHQDFLDCREPLALRGVPALGAPQEDSAHRVIRALQGHQGRMVSLDPPDHSVRLVNPVQRVKLVNRVKLGTPVRSGPRALTDQQGL
jgi:hypothetical protein